MQSEEDLKRIAKTWQIPNISDTDDIRAMQCRLEEMKQKAHDDGRKVGEQLGYEAGLQKGLQAAQAEIDALKLQIDHSLALLDKPLDLLENEAEKMVVDLIKHLCQRLVYRELAIEPEIFLNIVKQAKQLFAGSLQDCEVHMHPQDIESLKACVDAKKLVKYIADDEIEPGGCLLKSGLAEVDAGLASRIDSILYDLLDKSE